MPGSGHGWSTTGAMAVLVVVAACSVPGGGGESVTPVAGTTRSTVTTTSTPTGDPVPRPGEDWLAYEDTGFRIRLVRLDGTDDHPLDSLTSGPEDNPDWSPDGTRLAFVGSGDEAGSNAGLWVVNGDGTGLMRMVDCKAPCEYLDDPAWSPDGSRIAYSRQQPDAGHGGSLETVVTATGKSTTVLTSAPGQFYSGVRWSPDSKSLVFEWVQATPDDYDALSGVRLATLDLATKGAKAHALTPAELFAELADWSPTEDRIVYAAFAEAGDSGKDLFTISPDGSGRQQLTTLVRAGGSASHADFSNDGRSVVFVGVDSAAGLAGMLRVDLASRAVTSALGQRAVMGSHPRSRPIP